MITVVNSAECTFRCFMLFSSELFVFQKIKEFHQAIQIGKSILNCMHRSRNSKIFMRCLCVDCRNVPPHQSFNDLIRWRALTTISLAFTFSIPQIPRLVLCHYFLCRCLIERVNQINPDNKKNERM